MPGQRSHKSRRDRIALVTGAGGGIGAALARALAGEGARVVVTDIDGDRAAATCDAIGGLLSARLDVTDRASYASLVARVHAEHGPVEVLVNNAGVGLAGELRDVRPEDWARLVDVNLMGVVHGIDAVYPGMVERGRGEIITIGSGAGLCPRPGMAPYAATKAAVIALSTSLRAEAAAHGVRVSVACPGYIATDIVSNTVFRGVDGAGLMASVPLKPMTAEDCARIVLRQAAKGRAVIPVSRATQLEWLLYRWAPGLVGAIASYRARAFRKHRTETT